MMRPCSCGNDSPYRCPCCRVYLRWQEAWIRYPGPIEFGPDYCYGHYRWPLDDEPRTDAHGLCARCVAEMEVSHD